MKTFGKKKQNKINQQLFDADIGQSIIQVYYNKHIFCMNQCEDELTCPFHRNQTKPHEGELPALFKGTPYCPCYLEGME